MCMCVCVHLCRAYGLTQLIGNAALLSVRVALKCMFSIEAWGQRTLLERVVDGGRLPEHVTQGHPQSLVVRKLDVRKCQDKTKTAPKKSGLVLFSK